MKLCLDFEKVEVFVTLEVDSLDFMGLRFQWMLIPWGNNRNIRKNRLYFLSLYLRCKPLLENWHAAGR